MSESFVDKQQDVLDADWCEDLPFCRLNEPQRPVGGAGGRANIQLCQNSILFIHVVRVSVGEFAPLRERGDH